MTAKECSLPDELEHTHIAIQRVYIMAMSSLSPDELEEIKKLLIILARRRNGLD